MLEAPHQEILTRWSTPTPMVISAPAMLTPTDFYFFCFVNCYCHSQSVMLRLLEGEKKCVAHRPWFWLATTLVGITVTDTFLHSPYHQLINMSKKSGNDQESKVSIQRFAWVVAHQIIRFADKQKEINTYQRKKNLDTSCPQWIVVMTYHSQYWQLALVLWPVKMWFTTVSMPITSCTTSSKMMWQLIHPVKSILRCTYAICALREGSEETLTSTVLSVRELHPVQ